MKFSGMRRRALPAALLASASFLLVAATAPEYRAENLDRGLIAVPAISGGNLVQWRMRGTHEAGLRFHLFRDGRKLNGPPMQATSFHDVEGTPQSTYYLEAVGTVVGTSQTAQTDAWDASYMTVPLQKPAGGTTPDGVAYTYSAGDGSVADLDGDGDFEIIVKWDPSNQKDNSQTGFTGNVYLDAYTMEGQLLWRIDFGRNIRAGAHYTQFLVFDFDQDGKAEIVAKTADGTVDGEGRVIGDAAADHRNPVGVAPPQRAGFVLRGPEFLTVFNGATGRALSTVNYTPARHPDTQNPTPAQLRAIWGDDYGNRVDRFLATPAFLDPNRASIVMTRGYYTRSTLAAWDFIDGKLQPRWLFDSAAQATPADWMGQGNHNLTVADLDADGRDEIIFGSMAIDDNGTGMWSAKVAGRKLLHGDALHLSDFVLDRPGLERFSVHESPGSNGNIAASMVDADSGEVLWTVSGTSDNGRGVAADVDPRWAGGETWSNRHTGMSDANGTVVTPGRKPGPSNFLVYWDGDLQRELLDRITISKWNPVTNSVNNLLVMTGTISANGSKATPMLSGDILGDWREEVIMAAADSNSLRIYATPYPTQYRFRTLLSDRAYRQALVWQNVSYNQPPHLAFDLASTVGVNSMWMQPSSPVEWPPRGKDNAPGLAD